MITVKGFFDGFGEELFSDVSVAWVLTYRRRMYPCINRPRFDYLNGYQCTLTAVIKIYNNYNYPHERELTILGLGLLILSFHI